MKPTSSNQFLPLMKLNENNWVTNTLIDIVFIVLGIYNSQVLKEMG
jgi:hypothetical protein